MSVTATAINTPDMLAAPKAPARALPKQGRDWGRALKALGRLLADKEDTSQVFEIFRALGGGAGSKGYARLLTTAEGGRIAYERVELAERFMDRAWLESLPAGSVGAAYAEFTSRENISADGLIAESRRGVEDVPFDPRHPFFWFGRRIRDVHDIWHVLTGYGRDGLGELCLVSFSYPQTKSLGWALIAFGGYTRAKGKGGRPYRAAIREAWGRGRKADWLLGEDYVRLMSEPLESARARLGLTEPVAYKAIPADERNPLPMAA